MTSLILPLKNQVMFGAGAPSALHGMVASLPSRAVKLAGGFVRTGDEAEKQLRSTLKQYFLKDVSSF